MRAMLQDAILKPGCVPEVREELGKLHQQRQHEMERIDEVLQEAATQRDFMARLGEGVLFAGTIAVDGMWQVDFGEVSLTVLDTVVTGVGEKDVDSVGGTNLFTYVTGLGSTSPALRAHYNWRLDGQLFGRVCQVSITTTSEGDIKLYLFPRTATVEAYILFDISMKFAEMVEIKDGKLQDIVTIRKTRSHGVSTS